MMRFLLSPLLLILATVVCPAQALRLAVDWPTFLGQHDLVWEQLPRQWNEGAFVGNGQLGMMVYTTLMATGVQTTETLRTTEKTEFLKLFSVPSAVLSVSVVKIRSLVINALQLDFLGRVKAYRMADGIMSLVAMERKWRGR